MFDAKSMLENIVRGAAPAGSSTPGQPNGANPPGGSIGDILNDILRNAGGGTQGAQSGSGGGGVGDILHQISQSLSQAQTKSPAGVSSQPGQGTPSSSPDFANILAQIRDKLSEAGGSVSGSGGGSIGDILSRVLAQATQGVKEGSERIGQQTGASDALGRLTSDPQTSEMLEKLKGLIQNNPYASTAAAGGLGGLLLGTQTGRSVATGAAKLGALAMLGGLAYKAIQNYEQGKPLLSDSAGTTNVEKPQTTQAAISAEPPPTGSGYEAAAMTNDAAVHYLQAMIAAAFADGRIDPAEQAKIMTGIKEAGLDRESETFLANELNHPHTIEELAKSVQTPQEAIQLYAAARMAVADNSPAEEQFLGSLAQQLGLDPRLTAQIDATARAAA
ncbi:tellurite resistance TerB family protein [Hyphomicrobium sp.]|uniref:tellurite resistance TerB family protein n=1 Tax=Hyphomicrobium sp. TaxID=82 RepID=UPI000F9BA01B|nr:tellurite resistance TerB family protein [Hyphomicrobium sp.]RUP07562.1 MAG: tellurite resistance TerB family protein [Hyphomicrobium sp.]